jgi:hypothetical protein
MKLSIVGLGTGKTSCGLDAENESLGPKFKFESLLGVDSSRDVCSMVATWAPFDEKERMGRRYVHI